MRKKSPGKFILHHKFLTNCLNDSRNFNKPQIHNTPCIRKTLCILNLRRILNKLRQHRNGIRKCPKKMPDRLPQRIWPLLEAPANEKAYFAERCPPAHLHTHKSSLLRAPDTYTARSCPPPQPGGKGGGGYGGGGVRGGGYGGYRWMDGARIRGATPQDTGQKLPSLAVPASSAS